MALFTQRRKTFGILVLSMLAGAAFAATAVLPIAPLLPEQGQVACYAAKFDDLQELRFGWGRKVDKGPAPVMAMTVRISHPPPLEPPEDGSPSYGYGYLFDARIVADIKDKGRHHAPTQCDWTNHAISRFEPELYCGIDCDGGLVRLSRVPGRHTLEVTWLAERHLRMSSCGGGGAYLRAEGTAKTFRLEPAPIETCGGPPRVD